MRNGSQINAVMYVDWVSYPVAIMYDVIPSLGECDIEMAGEANELTSSLLQCAWPDAEESVTMLSFPNTIQANVAFDGQYVVMEIYHNAQCEGSSSGAVLTLLETCLDTGAESSLPQSIRAHFDGR